MYSRQINVKFSNEIIATARLEDAIFCINSDIEQKEGPSQLAEYVIINYNTPTVISPTPAGCLLEKELEKTLNQNPITNCANRNAQLRYKKSIELIWLWYFSKCKRRSLSSPLNSHKLTISLFHFISRFIFAIITILVLIPSIIVANEEKRTFFRLPLVSSTSFENFIDKKSLLNDGVIARVFPLHSKNMKPSAGFMVPFIPFTNQNIKENVDDVISEERPHRANRAASAPSLPPKQLTMIRRLHSHPTADSLEELFAELDNMEPCGRISSATLLRRILYAESSGPNNDSLTSVKGKKLRSHHSFGFLQTKTTTLSAMRHRELISLGQLYARHPHLMAAIYPESMANRMSSISSPLKLPPNMSIINGRPPIPLQTSSNGVQLGPVTLAFQLFCKNMTLEGDGHEHRADKNPVGKGSWVPLAIFPTSLRSGALAPQTYLQMRLPPLDIINICPFSDCDTKCHYTMHGGIQVFARTCCNGDSDTKYCIRELVLLHHIFYWISAICSFTCLLMIGVIVRERCRSDPRGDPRGWALMEPFCFGAAVLYAIPMIGWLEIEAKSCLAAIVLREIGFTLFYGSIILKAYRNLRVFRVRNAHHVVVRENDLLKYLSFIIFVVIFGVSAWCLGVWNDEQFAHRVWPQCPLLEKFTILSIVLELLALFYGLIICYKLRSSDGPEKYQHAAAILLELFITTIFNLIRLSLNWTGSNEALLILAVVHTHLTVSVNIVVIVTLKFLGNLDSNRRTLQGALGYNSSRAHPSLAKLRDNLLNGTIDFAEIPISDMNHEDIRAELKRVYTQLRMYKLKNAYQDNPHLNKRKGGAKKSGGALTVTPTANSSCEKVTSSGGQRTTASTTEGGKNRRISLPSGKVSSQSSAMVLAEGTTDLTVDHTVDSAPHNICLLRSGGESPAVLSSNANQLQAIRV